MNKEPSGRGMCLRLAKGVTDSLTLIRTSEPCIRGHRSTKCLHFDRLMVKVPRAGRPLSKCPHPRGACSCQRMYALMTEIYNGKQPVFQAFWDLTDCFQTRGPAADLYKRFLSIQVAASSLHKPHCPI